MKKKFFRVFATLLAVILSVACFAGCGGNKNEIKALLTEFENSCNSLDIDAMLECINPEIADKIKLALGVAGMFSKKDADEMIEALANMIASNDDIMSNEFFKTLEIDTEKISVDGKTATVDAIVKYEISGEDYEKEAVFNCVYYAEDWYIGGFDLKKVE